jgi:leucine dehydrogenase
MTTSTLKEGLSVTSVDVQSHNFFDGHKEVVFFDDQDVGLKGYLAVHNTNLGPAVGGTRYMKYPLEDDALTDALRLSRAMTYKCAVAGVSYGGGKSVLISSGLKSEKSPAYFKSYADVLTSIQSKFYTGEDVGLTEPDIVLMGRKSDRIIGRPSEAGLPAPWAALSVFMTMEVLLQSLFGSGNFRGRRIAVRGLGGVGSILVRLLLKAGAQVIGSDINMERANYVKASNVGLELVDASEINVIEADIYAPCALGNEFSPKTIASLKVKGVCGAANNQLSTDEDGERLFEAGILYIPDYLANAGGLINVVEELNPDGYSEHRVLEKISLLRQRAADLIVASIEERKSTTQLLDEMAKKIINK